MADSKTKKLDQLFDEMMTVNDEQLDYMEKYMDTEKPEDYFDQLKSFYKRNRNLQKRLKELDTE